MEVKEVALNTFLKQRTCIEKNGAVNVRRKRHGRNGLLVML
jgi:hypothetical protein